MSKRSMFNGTAALALLAGMMTASSGSAAVIDFTNSGDGSGTGVSLSCAEFGIFNDSCSVTFNQEGLGVDGAPDTQPGQVDGFPLFSSERLTFSFAGDVIWNNLVFGRWDSNDDARLTWSTGSITWGPNAGNSVNLGGVVSNFLTVTAYGQLGQDGFFHGYDDFTVASIDVSAVPLPAGAWLLLTGIGGLAAVRRRRKAA